jgi:hypothetical protein
MFTQRTRLQVFLCIYEREREREKSKESTVRVGVSSRLYFGRFIFGYLTVKYMNGGGGVVAAVF